MSKEKQIIKDILLFYYNKEKTETTEPKYVQFEHVVDKNYDWDDLTYFDELCDKNIIVLKTNLNKNDSLTVFLLLKILFDSNTLDYFDLIDDILIEEILKKENDNNDTYHSNETYHSNIKEKYGIDIYDTNKYMDEWIYYTKELFNNINCKVVENNILPVVQCYYNNHTFLHDVNKSLANAQKVFTISDILLDATFW